jgi:bile acid:Na+ symporter, BASS family
MDIDQVKINFSQDQMWLLNICLGFLMFSVALEITKENLNINKQNMKGPLMGFFAQLVIMPLLTLSLIYFLKPYPSIALGMALVAACPGGNVSNYAVHLAGANTGLSVLLTGISTLFAAFTTPGVFALLMLLAPSSVKSSVSFTLEPTSLLLSLIQLLLIPLVTGMALSFYYPKFSKTILPYCKKLSMIIFIVFIVGGVLGNLDVLKNHLHHVWWIVILHNSLALILGYYIPFWLNLPRYDARAISIETGIQNSGLALILVFKYFGGLGGMALIAAFWSIWHLISAFCLALYWQTKPLNQN